MFINDVAIPNTASATHSALVKRCRRFDADTNIKATDAPITRNQATLAGSTSSNRLTAIVAPMYCAVALRTKRASGGAEAMNEPTGPTDAARGDDEDC